MGKIEELQKMIGDWFESAQDKETVDKLSSMKKVCDDAKQEQDALQAEQKELMKDYKEIIHHTSFKDKANTPEHNAGFEKSIDAALADAIKEYKKK